MIGSPSADDAAPTLPSRAEIDQAVASGDGAQLDAVLRRVLPTTASADVDALELMLYAIDRHRLAESGIRRVLFDPDDVAEVAQDVLITIAEGAAAGFRGDAKFTSWLHGVARNKALEFLRRKRDHAALHTELGDSARISSMVANEVAVHRLLGQLPTPYRVAVSLRDLEGMAYADIAERLDLNLNTVRSHIARGRALLAKAVADAS